MRSSVLPAIAFVLISVASPAKAGDVENCIFLRAARDARSPAVQQSLCTCIVDKYRKLMSPKDFAVWSKYEEILTLGKPIRQVSEALNAYFVEQRISAKDGDAAITRVLDAMKKVPDTDCLPKQ
jgi:hypothetical protein